MQLEVGWKDRITNIALLSDSQLNYFTWKALGYSTRIVPQLTRGKFVPDHIYLVDKDFNEVCRVKHFKPANDMGMAMHLLYDKKLSVGCDAEGVWSSRELGGSVAGPNPEYVNREDNPMQAICRVIIWKAMKEGNYG